MGIYDREYYRREGPSFLGSLAEQGRVTNWLIGLNILCFIIQVLTRVRPPLPAELTEQLPEFQLELMRRSLSLVAGPFENFLILDVDQVMHGQVWRLLTYGFLHSTGSLWHILFNMLFLFWFGRQVEETVGGREYLWFYLTGVVLGGLGFTLACQMNLHVGHRALGASAGVTAVLVLAACYHPRQIIYLFFLIPVPIWLFVVVFVVADAFDLLGNKMGGTATSAHLAGAAFGFCYYKFGWRLSGWTGWLGGLARRGARPRLRVYREDEGETPTPRPGPAPAAVGASRLLEDEHLEAQVDAILEKIPRVGMEGLTENERQLLLRASEAIKRRRG
jgi:membrane associated rhomboid family serine protease